MPPAPQHLAVPLAFTISLLVAATSCGGLESEFDQDSLQLAELSGGSPLEKLSYTPVIPCRVVDTRIMAGGALAVGVERRFVVRGDVSAQGGSSGGCPSPVEDPHAVHFNVTVLPQGSGYLTVWPAGGPDRRTSFINYGAGPQIVANAGIVETCVGCTRDVAFKAGGGGAHVVVDVLGYFAPDTEVAGETDRDLVFTPVAPCRIADTRRAGGVLAPGEQRALRVYGAVAAQGGSAGGCAAPRGEPRAAHLKLVAVPQPGASLGNVAAFAKGAAAPAAGSLFYLEGGQNIANSVIVPTLHDGSAPEIELQNRTGRTHLVVDVLGYYYENDADDPPPNQDLLFVPVAPCRIADTRLAGGTLAPNQELSLRVHGSVSAQGGAAIGCTAPLGEPRAVHLNMTAVPRSGAGYMAVEAAGAGVPSVGTINYDAASQNIADALTVRTTYAGVDAPDVSVMNRQGRADLVVDVLGYFYAATDSPGPIDPPSTLRVGIYNIKNFDAARPDRNDPYLDQDLHLTTAINNIDADVLLIQEQATARLPWLEFVAGLGGTYPAVPENVSWFCGLDWQCKSVLSKRRIVNQMDYYGSPTPFVGHNTRVDIDVDGVLVTFYSIHFTAHYAEQRVREAKYLRDLVNQLRQQHPLRHVIVGGDFNSLVDANPNWQSGEPSDHEVPIQILVQQTDLEVISVFDSQGQDGTARNPAPGEVITPPDVANEHRIDFILMTSELLPYAMSPEGDFRGAIYEGPGNEGSDHRALYVDLSTAAFAH